MRLNLYISSLASLMTLFWIYVLSSWHSDSKLSRMLILTSRFPNWLRKRQNWTCPPGRAAPTQGSPALEFKAARHAMQSAPYIRAFKLQTFKDANGCFISVRSEWNRTTLSHVADGPSALPSPAPLPPPGSNFSFLFTRFQPRCASSWTRLLYFSRYCIIKLKMFPYFLCLLFYVLFVWEAL